MARHPVCRAGMPRRAATPLYGWRHWRRRASRSMRNASDIKASLAISAARVGREGAVTSGTAFPTRSACVHDAMKHGYLGGGRILAGIVGTTPTATEQSKRTLGTPRCMPTASRSACPASIPHTVYRCGRQAVKRPAHRDLRWLDCPHQKKRSKGCGGEEYCSGVMHAARMPIVGDV